MRTDRLVYTVDFHTAGVGLRLVTGGLERIRGTTMAEKQRYFQEKLDDVRTGLCMYPRGHRDLLVAVLTEPVTDEADFGLLFMHSGGWLASCGEATFGAVSLAVETGLIRAWGPETPIKVDTVGGTVDAVAHVDGDGGVSSVSVRLAPAFVVLTDEIVKVPGLGEIPFDVAVGAGNVFGYVQASAVDVRIEPGYAGKISETGTAILEALKEQFQLEIPSIGETPPQMVLLYEGPDENGDCHNSLIWGPRRVDPAPCGTGTCGRLALLHHQGRLGVGESIRNHGLLGTWFEGRVLAETEVEAGKAVLPEITATSYITGFSHFAFHPDDPFRDGFMLDV